MNSPQTTAALVRSVADAFFAHFEQTLAAERWRLTMNLNITNAGFAISIAFYQHPDVTRFTATANPNGTWKLLTGFAHSPVKGIDLNQLFQTIETAISRQRKLALLAD